MRVLLMLDRFMFSMYQRDWGHQHWAGGIYLVMMLGVMIAAGAPFWLLVWWLS